jgi:hypothetical protein
VNDQSLVELNYAQLLAMADNGGNCGGIAVEIASPVAAQKKYDPGATDREINIGNIMPIAGQPRPMPRSERLTPRISRSQR